MKRFLYFLYRLLLMALTVIVVWYFWTMLIFLLPVFILIFLLPVFSTYHYFVTRRRQRMVLRLVRTAMETQTPLDEVLDAYAETCWEHPYRRKVRRFAEMLRNGSSITEAANSVKGVLRYDAVGILDLGGGADALGKFLCRTENEQMQGQTDLQSIFRLYWFCWYIPFLTLLPLFYMICIMPKMEAIFQDFLLELPPLTVLCIVVSRWTLDYFFLWSPCFLFLIFAIVLYFSARSGIMRWRPFGIRTIMRQIDAVRFLRIFAAGLEQHRTIPETVDAYKRAVPSSYLKWKVGQFIKNVEQGNHWIEALRNIKYLTRSEAVLLESAVQVQNVAPMLDEIAAGKEQQQIAADNTRGKIVFIAVVLTIGIFVGFQAVAFFLPLVKLIAVLSS